MENNSILIVDDEPTNLKMMERLLKGTFRTFIASSGAEALDILQRERVSILITDQRMPGMTGTELLRTARHLDPDMIFLLMTVNRDATTFIDAMVNSGAIGVITKPWEPDNVLSTINDAVEKYEARRNATLSRTKLKGAIDAFDKIAHSKEQPV